MADLLIILPAFLQLLGEFILAFGGCCHLTGILAVIHHILHPVDLGFIYALHLMQVVDAQVSDGIRRVAVQVDQCLEAVLLAAVKQPVDRTLAGTSDRVCLAVILEEVVQEVIADDLPAGTALIAKGFCDIVEVCFQRIGTVHHFQPCAQARYDIIVQIFFIGDGDNIVGIRNIALVFAAIPLAACIGQSFHIQRVTAKHTAHRIAQQALDVSLQIRLAHGHIFILHFRCQLILQAVDVNKNVVQLFFVGFQLVKTVIAFRLPLGKGFGNCGDIAEQWMFLKVPRIFKRIPIIF